MGDTYDEHGEKLDFVGSKETHVRGKLVTDGMNRWRISVDGQVGSQILPSILPDEIDTYEEADQDGDTYLFSITVNAWEPTGEFKEDEADG